MVSKALLLIGLPVAVSTAPIGSSSRTVSLDVSRKWDSDIRPIDGSWQSFSIEFAYVADYLGNKSQPNVLTYNLLQALQDRSGKSSVVRAGGLTANSYSYNASQELAVINVYGDNADRPDHTYIGPAWYEGFQNMPKGVKFIYDINYTDNSTEGVANTVTDAKRTYDILGDKLYAFELGNEMERWANKNRSADWSPEVYVEDYLKYTALFDKNIWGDDADKVEPFFQGGVLMGNGGWGGEINRPWNSVRLLDLGLNRNGQIKSMSQHDYDGSNCQHDDPWIIPTLRQALLNHTNIVHRSQPHVKMAPVAKTYGVDYVLGETNSISCQGRDNVSNVFGSALWYVNFNLYFASSTLVDSLYFHSGTPYRYSLWAPFEGATDHSALIRPSYYGALMLATAIGDRGGKKQVRALVQEETFVAYALYAHTRLDSVVVVNMEPFNATMSGPRPHVDIKLPDDAHKPGKIMRLSADGADVKDGVTWAGQTVSEHGEVQGREVSERYWPGCTVSVPDSEAVLIKF